MGFMHCDLKCVLECLYSGDSTFRDLPVRSRCIENRILKTHVISMVADVHSDVE